MHKAAVLATALIFGGSSLAFAMPASVGAAGRFFTGPESSVTLVAKNKAQAQKKAKKPRKKGSKSGGGMNMKGMPPGHKM